MCATHESKQRRAAAACSQGRQMQVERSHAKQRCRRSAGSMQAEWTDPMRRGLLLCSLRAAPPSVLAHAAHEACRGGRCKPDVVVAWRYPCRQGCCLDQGSTPRRTRSKDFAVLTHHTLSGNTINCMVQSSNRTGAWCVGMHMLPSHVRVGLLWVWTAPVRLWRRASRAQASPTRPEQPSLASVGGGMAAPLVPHSLTQPRAADARVCPIFLTQL